ncbi:hypothetical protein [Bacillus cereus]|uniref:hypothetical protein n=1 Tax=Bacillus cereus TaxID=1396 RepID=UPI003CF63D92
MKRGQISSRDLPPIKIFKHQGNIHSFDNRRLYAAKKAGVNVRVQWATAKEIQKELRKGKLSTKNQGEFIILRESSKNIKGVIMWISMI